MKKSFFLTAVATVLASAACNAEKGNESATAAAASPAAQVQAPKSGDWSEIVTATPEGGFLMGNPNAPVKLVEYGSMTCPHCAEFEEQGTKALIDTYVKPGRVAFEFRNYVRDPFDLAVSLITRCNGAKTFFPLTRGMYEDQKNWIAKLQQIPPERQQALSTLGPEQQFLEIAKLAGFQQWAAQRGVPSAKSTQCLTNRQEIDRLVQMNSDAVAQYPEFPGTPSFTINGKLLERTANWQTLEPQLREAVGS